MVPGSPNVTTEDRRQQAIAASLLATFSSASRDQLLADALSIEVPAGSILYRDDDEPRCALVVSGVVRVFLSAPDGRAVTVRYARSGDLLGVPAIVAGPMPVGVQMVTPSTLLVLNTQVLQRLGQTEPRIGWLLAQEIAHRLYETLEAVADNAFGSLRQRVARHLFDLATTGSHNGLTAAVTQQDLAEAVGSSRAVVARIIGDLRRAGLLATSPRGIEILDPEGLLTETWSRHLAPM
jgi:CRP/FNR family cyclic AMP-dependent transcriptional regulator